MHYSVFRLGGERVAVVLVERRLLLSDCAAPLLAEIQAELSLPAILIAQDDSTWRSVRTYAEFDVRPYLGSLLSVDDADWSPVPVSRHIAQHQAKQA